MRGITSNGGSVGPLRVGVGPFGRGVFASAPIEEGTVVLRVPLALCFTHEAAGHTQSGRVIAAEWKGEASGPVLLAAALLELQLTQDPRWSTYIDTLPERIPTHPAHLSLADRAALTGTCAKSLIVDIDTRHDSEWRWLRDRVPGFVRLTAEAWSSVRILVTSRQFHLTDELGTALVPFADLFNHAAAANLRWTFDSRSNTFLMRVVRNVSAGEEVLVSYGAKSNLRMLLHYGFTLPDNPEDEIILDAPGVGSMVLPRELTPAALAAAAEAMGVQSAVPGQRRRAWRRLAGVLRDRLSRLPGPAPEGHPIRESIDRLVEGERAVLTSWIGHAETAGG